jgi:hypothetical protein
MTEGIPELFECWKTHMTKQVDEISISIDDLKN